MDSIKKMGLWIIFLILLFIGFIVALLLQCFVFNKDPGKSSDTDTISLTQNNDINENSQISQNSSNSLNRKFNKDEIINGIKNSKAGEFVSEVHEGYEEEKVNDTEYSTINFDDVLLLYDGDQNFFGVNKVIERLIEDADNDFYSKPDVTLNNFSELSNNSIVFNNAEDYKSALNEVKGLINESDKYNISFGFGPLHAIANEVIITRK